MIAQSIQAITHCATKNYCSQSINGARRLAQLLLTLDQVAGAARFIVELVVQFHSTPLRQNFTSVRTLLGSMSQERYLLSAPYLLKYERGAKNG